MRTARGYPIFCRRSRGATLPGVSRVAAVIACAALALVAAGCGSSSKTSKVASAPPTTVAAKPTCPAGWRPVYQRLANKIHAAVYCPSWMPSPLTGQIGRNVSFGGAGGSSLSVDKDGSYLALFVWAEPGSGEVHVNLRGYPGGRRSRPASRRTRTGRS